MTISLFLKPDRLEPVYGWLEQNGGAQVQLWAWENDRRAALLAYSDGPDDAFGWSNWASNAGDDPSVLCALFERLELAARPTWPPSSTPPSSAHSPWSRIRCSGNARASIGSFDPDQK